MHSKIDTLSIRLYSILKKILVREKLYHHPILQMQKLSCKAKIQNLVGLILKFILVQIK